MELFHLTAQSLWGNSVKNNMSINSLYSIHALYKMQNIVFGVLVQAGIFFLGLHLHEQQLITPPQ